MTEQTKLMRSKIVDAALATFTMEDWEYDRIRKWITDSVLHAAALGLHYVDLMVATSEEQLTREILEDAPSQGYAVTELDTPAGYAFTVRLEWPKPEATP